MSLDRLPALPPQPPASTQPTRDIRAAQRAFFQAAVTPVAEPAPTARTVAATTQPPAVDPERPLRPGSFVDIRV